MPIYQTNFTRKTRHTELIDNNRHPLFEDVKPLTPQQMLVRCANGQPISVHKPSDQIKFNSRFYQEGDKMDVLDTIRLQLIEKQKKFSGAKPDGAVAPLSSTAPTDTNDEEQGSQRSEES